VSRSAARPARPARSAARRSEHDDDDAGRQPRRGPTKRHERIRLRLAGTPTRPRLAVFRSLNHIYAQVIDDTSGRTLAAASSVEKGSAGPEGPRRRRPSVSVAVAERAKAAGIERSSSTGPGSGTTGGPSLAEAAREAGLDF
jgi:large subunit ribosomal protein L18